MDLQTQYPVIVALGSFILGMLSLRLLTRAFSVSLGPVITSLLNQFRPSNLKTWCLSLGLNLSLLSPQVSQVFALSLTSTGLLGLRQGIFLVSTSVLPLLLLLILLLVSYPVSPWLFLALGGGLYFLLRPKRFRGVAEALFSFGLVLLALQTLVRVLSHFSVQEEYYSFVFFLTDDRFFTLVGLYLLSLGLSLVARSTLFSIFLTSAALLAGIISLSGAMLVVLGEITGFGLVVWIYARWSSRQDSRSLGFFALAYPMLVSLIALLSMPTLNPWLRLWAQPLESYLPRAAISQLGAFVLWLTLVVMGMSLFGLLLGPLYSRYSEKRDRTYRGKGPQNLRFINPEMGLSPALAIELLREEVLKLSTLVYSMLDLCSESLFKQADQKLAKYENITDRVQDEVQNFLIELSQHPMVRQESVMARGLMKVTSSLESIADECRAIVGEGSAGEEAFPESFRENYLFCLEGVKDFYEDLFDHLEVRDNSGPPPNPETPAQILSQLDQLQSSSVNVDVGASEAQSMFQLVQRLKLIVEKMKNIREARSLMGQ